MNVPASPNQAHVSFDSVSMRYGSRTVFSDLSCTFPRGAISVVLGGSGTGKSTILRLIGGLSRPYAGTVLVEDENVAVLNEPDLYTIRRKLGMMFQGGALLDSMTVFDNIAFPLREHTRLGEREIADKVHENLASVGLNDVDNLLPGELSGGMTKRVALARALTQEPVIVLVDEPFSGLDPMSTKLIEALLVKINRERQMTMIVVSHHIPSTLRMADKIVLLTENGAVEGSPAELKACDNPYVRSFLNEEADDAAAALADPIGFESSHRPGPGRFA